MYQVILYAVVEKPFQTSWPELADVQHQRHVRCIRIQVIQWRRSIQPLRQSTFQIAYRLPVVDIQLLGFIRRRPQLFIGRRTPIMLGYRNADTLSNVVDVDFGDIDGYLWHDEYVLGLRQCLSIGGLADDGI